MVDLVECLAGSCPQGESTWKVLIDLLAPMLLDFLVFSIVVGWVLKRREEKSNRRLMLITRARIAVLVDRLLCRMFPAGSYELAPRRVELAEGMEVSLAYGATPPSDISVGQVVEDIRARRGGIGQAVARARSDLSEIIMANGYLLDVSALQSLSEFEMKLDGLERSLAAELEDDEVQDVAVLIRRTAVAGELILRSVEKARPGPK